MSVRDPFAEDAKALHIEIDAILAKDLDDLALRDALEALEERKAIHLVYYRLIRSLLEKNPVVFGPLVRPRLDSWGYDRNGKWHHPWTNDEGKRDLAFILKLAEERGDDALFKRAMLVYLDRAKWKDRNALFQKELLARLEGAAEPHERASVLSRFDRLGVLDDDTALTIYAAAPLAGRSFISRHLPWRPWGTDDVDLLPKLLEETRDRDPDFYFELYRRLAGDATWARDVDVVLREASDDALAAELEKLHPQRYVKNAAKVFAKALKERDDAALPYVSRHVDAVVRGFFGRGEYGDLLRIAYDRGYDTLWAGLLRHAAPPKDWNAEVRRLAEVRRDGGDARRRLLLLAGAGRELSLPGLGLARLQPLEDDTAVLLFERYPELLRGPFKRNIFGGWHQPYTKLVARVLAEGDELLIDFLASRFVTRGGPYMNEKVLASAATLSKHYEALRGDPVAFAERAANVLGQVPPFVIYAYELLLETNRLARLLYEHAARDYLASPVAIRDLLEAPEIHAQRLAFLALSLDDERARTLGAANLDLLAATLLRPLHRRTRLLAMDALDNAARDEATAARVLHTAREAMFLPDVRYPKEELVGLLGRILHRHASLRSERERPVVYGRA